MQRCCYISTHRTTQSKDKMEESVPRNIKTKNFTFSAVYRVRKDNEGNEVTELQSLELEEKQEPKLCNDELPSDTKYWLCGCSDYPEDHIHTRSRPECFPVSRLTEENEDTDI